ncbi:hypothetical protein [Pontibacter sp. G13]|uniref:hypothetical protein n=1 Tax=Pontibacter sp. G13 TaxID=3074898 RepID=UPI002889424E|nr:hypothetical protein [Pontibacter sp. G13]WNJ18506.1 hypothetical protein RJD25_26930 [Pontibacter sp. G13]
MKQTLAYIPPKWFFPAIPVVLITGLAGILLWSAWQHNDQQLIFPLDDTYIHLAISEHLVETGIWAPTGDRFQSTSSSPGFTILLSTVMKLLGNHAWLPLLINFPVGIALVVQFWRWISAEVSNSVWGSLLTLIFSLLLPVHLLILCGLEHIVHIGLIMSVGYSWARWMSGDQTPRMGVFWTLVMLSVWFRYESLFLVAAMGGLMMLRKQWKDGLVLWGVGWTPVLIMGIWSIGQGGTFLPLSILSKGHAPGLIGQQLWGVLLRGLESLYENPFIWVQVIVLLAGLVRSQWLGMRWRRGEWLAVASLFAAIPQIWLAEIGGYRYEAWWMGLAMLAIIQIGSTIEFPRMSLKSWALMGITIGVLMLPLGMRSMFFTANYRTSTTNVYHQHIQISKFFQAHFPKASVATNDIGALSYFTDIRLTDLVGLGDQAVYEAIQAGDHGPSFTAELTNRREIQFAVIHEFWTGRFIPENWVAVADWTIPDNFICAGPTMTFFASDSLQAKTLEEALTQFQSELPPSIDVEYRHPNDAQQEDPPSVSAE